MASFPNIWTHRKVAETASKPYEAAIAAKKKKEMDEEIERVKQEFEEKQKRKKEKEKEKETAKKDDKEKDGKDTKEEGKQDEKTDEKKKSDTPLLPAQGSAKDEEPRVFSLKKALYQQRLDKKKQAEIAKRNRERLQNPNLFPQVPRGLP
ncbi:hypothetical protein DSL72_001149 [Monilinia vaccinii-corymbosi]|uniref:Uncharacterized protein n=1 Tax=Monilinia vaccinii-corymbosi TaxID=61207 RepID=A0A8A3P395_9HELO|nr:hypothetical protein DSL72_001149 [Monilinia vaccinii-corymbosi]